MTHPSASLTLLFLGVLFLGSPFAMAAADIGGVVGGAYQSAVLLDEKLEFGDVKTTIQRRGVFVPESYGKLISITPSERMAVLWYQSEEGVIRNIMIPQDLLWKIERRGLMQREK